MPGKEAVVEVENAVLPEPVTKEVPKCEAPASVDVKGVEEETVKTTETAPEDESKPQDTEVTSSAEQKAEEEEPTEKADSNVEKEDSLNDKTEKEAESTNGSVKTEEKTVVEESANGEAKPDVADSKEPDAVKGCEAVPEAVPEVEGVISSEAAAKETTGIEKMEVEKEPEPEANPDVTGSDEAKISEAEGAKENGTLSADSSTEKKPDSSEVTDDKPGSSSVVVEHDLEKQIAELKKKGVALYVGKDYCAAADTFGKILEVAAPLYGEMSEKLAETYYMYGTAMFEYGKDQNDVLGEKVKEKDDEEEGDDEEQMEVDEKPTEPSEEAEEAEKRPSTPTGSGETKEASEMKEDEAKEPTKTTEADETINADEKEEEDEDDAFRVAWEMLELAKATFQKADNKKRLADTLMKLGDVGIETGDSNAIAEMVEGLKVRKELYAANHRIIPETHFKIGVAFAYFEKYDEAIEHFSEAKECLEKRIEELSTSEAKEDKDEVEEMKSILPEIQEKIQDTKESKLDKEKIKSTMGESSKDAVPETLPAPSESAKPAANISHLVKRKRKVDEILPERAAKQSRQDGEESVASTIEEPAKEAESAKPEETEEKEITEEMKPVEAKEEPKPEEAKVETIPEAVKAETKPEEANVATKPEEANVETKPEEANVETKPEEAKGETKSDEVKEPQKEPATTELAETTKPEEAKPEEVQVEAKPDEKMEE